MSDLIKERKIIFMGTPEFAAESLRELVKRNFNIVAVVTAPDKPAGRGQKLAESDVKIAAKELHLNILQPTNLKSVDFLSQLKTLNADLFVVVAFRMLPESVWCMPPLGTINLHASLLPDYRGAAPINRAIMNGETKTGLTTFFIEKEIDTGKIIRREEILIGDNESAGQLHDRMMLAGALLLAQTCEDVFEGAYKALAQSEIDKNPEVLKFAPKIFKDDCRIDWNNCCESVYNYIRGLSPYPAAFTEIKERNSGEILSLKIYKVSYYLEKHSSEPGTFVSDGKKFLRVATNNGYIVIEELQPAGKKKMKIQDFLNGIRIENFEIV
jgi:methionyl-tRNA formyltransferase